MFKEYLIEVVNKYNLDDDTYVKLHEYLSRLDEDDCDIFLEAVKKEKKKRGINQ